MEIEEGNKVGNLLRELIEVYLPRNTEPGLLVKYKSYFSRILSSRISPAMKEQEGALLTRMHNQAIEISSTYIKNDNWGQKRPQRLQECFQRLSRTTILKQRPSILKVLSNLANQKTELTIKGPLFTQSSPKPLPEYQQISSTINDNSNFRKVNRMDAEGSKAELTRKGIVRQLMFIFQGIDSSSIKYEKTKDAFVVDDAVELEANEREMVVKLSEMGILFQKINGFLDQQSSKITGLTFQSLSYAIKEELNQYYRFIAILENMRDSSFAESPLTLKSLYLWTLEPMDSLKWIAILCDSCRPLKGGQVLSALFSYSSHGCPQIQNLVDRLLTKALSPFMNFLKHWVYSGELVDPMCEFFIEISQKNPIGNDKIWTEKYKINNDMIPSFISRKTAEAILIVGKTKLFMRKFCTDTKWYLSAEFIKVENLISFKFMEGLKFGALENWITSISAESNSKLKEVIIKEFAFYDHCRMVKNFLLLGKGDFMNTLLENLQTLLEDPATKVYKHSLTSVLDSALISCAGSGYKKEQLDRLGVYLFESTIGYKGWDIFSLHYEIDAPLNTVFELDTMVSYYKIFNFVWKIKNLVYCLNSFWKTHRKAYQSFRRSSDLNEKINFCNLVRHQMLHFLKTVLSYIMLEVIEAEWATFISAVDSATCLDDIIQHHRELVSNIMDRALLSEEKLPLYREFMKLIDSIVNFNKTQGIIFMHLEEELQRNMEEHKYGEENSLEESEQQSSGFIEERKEGSRDLMKENNHLINKLWKGFKTGFENFLDLLEKDPKMKTLAFRLDFNEFYKSRRDTRESNTRYLHKGGFDKFAAGRKMDIENRSFKSDE
jgi:gamma-tubulin complex component 3